MQTFIFEGNKILIIPGILFSKKELKNRLNLMEIPFNDKEIQKQYYSQLYDNNIQDFNNKMKIIDKLVNDTNIKYGSNIQINRNKNEFQTKKIHYEHPDKIPKILNKDYSWMKEFKNNNETNENKNLRDNIITQKIPFSKFDNSNNNKHNYLNNNLNAYNYQNNNNKNNNLNEYNYQNNNNINDNYNPKINKPENYNLKINNKDNFYQNIHFQKINNIPNQNNNLSINNNNLNYNQNLIPNTAFKKIGQTNKYQINNLNNNNNFNYTPNNTFSINLNENKNKQQNNIIQENKIEEENEINTSKKIDKFPIQKKRENIFDNERYNNNTYNNYNEYKNDNEYNDNNNNNFNKYYNDEYNKNYNNDLPKEPFFNKERRDNIYSFLSLIFIIFILIMSIYIVSKSYSPIINFTKENVKSFNPKKFFTDFLLKPLLLFIKKLCLDYLYYFLFIFIISTIFYYLKQKIKRRRILNEIFEDIKKRLIQIYEINDENQIRGLPQSEIIKYYCSKYNISYDEFINFYLKQLNDMRTKNNNIKQYEDIYNGHKQLIWYWNQ